MADFKKEGGRMINFNNSKTKRRISAIIIGIIILAMVITTIIPAFM
ncbi:MAG: hypothetical protein Q4B70_02600 [Lachnospiraceae bacterium]|nr:hypothetical protein [Lachnospiraceae bacterium]